MIEFLGIGKSAKLPADLSLLKEVDGPANCRRSPNGPTVFSIPDHMKVTLRERESDWYRVKFNGRECWTYRKNLRFLAEAR